jgi:predicted ATPase
VQSFLWRVLILILYCSIFASGPCGGKTTCLNYLKPTLKALGYNVFTVPEVYTLFCNNGVEYPGDDKPEEQLKYNIEKFKYHIHSEETFRQLASISGKPSVIILDRGIPDNAAYVTDECFNKVCDTIKETRQSLLDRYDIVCHLISAADGAEEHYTTANNEVRTETVEEAKIVDKSTLSAWAGHHDYHVIKNNPGGIKQKFDEVTKIIVDYAAKVHREAVNSEALVKM